MSLNFLFGSGIADLAKRYVLLWLLRLAWLYMLSGSYFDKNLVWLLGIPFPWLITMGEVSAWWIDTALAALQVQTLWRFIQRLINRSGPPDDGEAGRRRFMRDLLGAETRLRPLIAALAMITALRVGWIAINDLPPSALNSAFAFLPWPSVKYSGTAFLVELVLVAYQLRALLRLARVLLLKYAPEWATLFGFSKQTLDDSHHVTPRNRSWMPTALQFCGLLILTCCALTWITVMLWYLQWVPFDYFMGTVYGDRAFYVALGLSVLGFLFGGRYIARASGNISASFGVTPVPNDHWLAERVHSLAEKLNLPKPAVGTMNVMNAYAVGSNQKTAMVVIGQPLFAFEKDELDAIIGHELGHILHKDVARMQFAEGFQRMLVGVVNAVTVFGAIMAATAAKTRSSALLSRDIALGSGALVRKTVFISSELLAKGISRNREFHADAVGAYVTTADAMARALKRVHGVVEKPTAEEHHYGYLMFRGAGFGRLLSTHPSLDARLKALDARALSQETAQLSTDLGAAIASEGLGVSNGSTRVPSVASVQASKIVRGLIKRGKSFSTWRNIRLISVAVVACGIVVAIIPAMINFYELDRRFNDARSLATSTWDSSLNWAAQTKQAAFEALVPTSPPLPPASQPVSTLVSTELDNARQVSANLRRENGDLQNQLAVLKEENSALANRVREQARTVSDTRPAETVDAQTFNDLQNQLAVLKAENTGLANRVREQAKTITDWTGERIIDQQKMRDYEQQIALQDIKLNELSTAASQQPALPVAYWIAATVNSRGSVNVVTRANNREDAERQALAKCKQSGSGCKFIGSYENACFSVARPEGHPILPGNYWYAGDAQKFNANKRAVMECNRVSGAYCSVAISFCASEAM